MSEYEARALIRWRRGVALIRGGPHLPFQGDPVAEGIEECLDLRNYAGEARAQGRIGWLRHAAIVASGWLAYRLLRGAQR